MYEVLKYIGIFSIISFISYLSYDIITEYYNEKNKLKNKNV